MGYFLSEQYGIPHGNACAVYLPEFIDHNIKNASADAKDFFAQIGTDREGLIDTIKLNLPKIDVTLREEKLQELLTRFSEKCYGNVDVNMAEDILRKLFM